MHSSLRLSPAYVRPARTQPSVPASKGRAMCAGTQKLRATLPVRSSSAANRGMTLCAATDEETVTSEGETVAEVPAEEEVEAGEVIMNAPGDTPFLFMSRYVGLDSWGHPQTTPDDALPEVPVSLMQGGDLTVGSGADCDLKVELDGVDAKHATISLKDGELFITDLGTSTGTTVARIKGMKKKSSNKTSIMEVPACLPNQAVKVPPNSRITFGSKFATFDFRMPTIAESVKLGNPPASMEVLPSRYSAPYAGSARPTGYQTFTLARVSNGDSSYLFESDVADSGVIVKKTVGSDPSCDIVLDSQFVSEKHAVVELRGSEVFVTDCGSLNGTTAASSKGSNKTASLIPEVAMRIINGDKVCFGDASVAFQLSAKASLTVKPVVLDGTFRPWIQKKPKDDMVDSGKGKDFKAPSFPLLLNGEAVTVGSDESCDVVIPITFVSSKHAKVEKIEGKLYVTDLGSTNGSAIRESLTATPVDCTANEAKLLPEDGYVTFGNAGEYFVYKCESWDAGAKLGETKKTWENVKK